MARTTKGIGKAANVTKISGKVTDISKTKVTDVSKAKIGKDGHQGRGLAGHVHRCRRAECSSPRGRGCRSRSIRRPASQMDDLRFEVKEGPHAGQVSPCRDRLYDPAKPNIMLIAGPRAGKFTLEAFKKGAAKAVGSAQFTVTNIWTKAGYRTFVLRHGRGEAAARRARRDLGRRYARRRPAEFQCPSGNRRPQCRDHPDRHELGTISGKSAERYPDLGRRAAERQGRHGRRCHCAVCVSSTRKSRTTICM